LLSYILSCASHRSLHTIKSNLVFITQDTSFRDLTSKMRLTTICQCVLVLVVSTMLSVQASPDSIQSTTKTQQVSKLRGSDANDERSLDNNNNNNAYNQWRYNQNGGGYNQNYGQNNYMGNRNYAYGNYYMRQYYKPYYGKYYNKQEEEANSQDGNNNDEGDDASASTDDTYNSIVPTELEEKFWQWYESPPSDWTSAQWAWFSGILVVTVGFMFCCCLGCANLCMEGSDRAFNKKEYDDYHLDRDKSGSFMTLNTKGSDGYTAGGDSAGSVNTAESGDDDATYDSIMRLRSSG
jgi:hypothetical protein